MRGLGRLAAPVAVLLSVSLALFAFFAAFYPYHFFHREQFSLFVASGEFIRQMLSQGVIDGRSWLPSVVGGFLTQFYYYFGGGPAIVALAVLAVGFSSFFLAVRLRAGRWVALAVAVAFMLWEAGRQCVGEYPLASTLSLLFGLLAALAYPVSAGPWARVGASVALSALCVSSLGYGGALCVAVVAVSEAVRRRWAFVVLPAVACALAPHYGFTGAAWFGRPDFETEAFLRADTRTWASARLADDDFPESVSGGRIGSSLRFLSLARRDSDLALDSMRWNACDIFLPVDPSGGYLQFTAAGEVWFALGDMTMAEHATMLGMIFSPNRIGARHVKRLAEINLVRGDTPAAEKYLSILRRTTVRSSTVPSIIRQAEAGGRLHDLKGLASASDTLRAAADYKRSLRNLLEANPSNDLARIYLLALDMQRKELADFLDDYLRFAGGRMTRAYAEALMAVSATAPPSEVARLEGVRIPATVAADFRRFNDLMAKRDVMGLRREFANSYWLYCQRND